MVPEKKKQTKRQSTHLVALEGDTSTTIKKLYSAPHGRTDDTTPSSPTRLRGWTTSLYIASPRARVDDRTENDDERID
eukprot:617-Pelagococcus_subviridis.AAC.2